MSVSFVKVRYNSTMNKKRLITLRLGGVYRSENSQIHITFLDRCGNWAGFSHFDNGKDCTPKDGTTITELRKILDEGGFEYSHMDFGA